MVPRILGQFETPELREIAEQAGRAYSMSVPLFLLKSHFDRVRPSFLDSNIKPSISVPSHPAYPSGHSTQATTMALAVSCVDPMNRDFYLSNLVGWRRELAGVHYPSDTAAGKKLASFVFADVAMEIGLANATLCNATIF
jgi:membrane-associated phospholipid phosphatase